MGEATDWVNSLPDGPAKRDAQRNLSYQMAENDPQAAASYAQSLPTGAVQNDFITRLASAWANADLNAAVAWAQKLPDGQAKQNAFNIRPLPGDGCRPSPPAPPVKRRCRPM